MLSRSDGVCLSGAAGEHPPRWGAGKGSSICPVSAMGAPPGGRWFGREPKHQNPPKKSPVSSQQTMVWDAGCPAGGVPQLSLGRDGGVTVVPCEMCLGVGCGRQILAEVKEVLEMPPSNISPFTFGLVWRLARWL